MAKLQADFLNPLLLLAPLSLLVADDVISNCFVLTAGRPDGGDGGHKIIIRKRTDTIRRTLLHKEAPLSLPSSECIRHIAFITSRNILGVHEICMI